MVIKVNQDGTITCIHHGRDGAQLMNALGGSQWTMRASHVEPVNTVLCFLFHAVRSRVTDDSRLAAWTRKWSCLWRVRIFNGPTLYPFVNRQDALDWEVKWLREHRI